MDDTREQLKAKLLMLGAREADVESIIDDVHAAIAQKCVLTSLEKMGAAVLKTFESLTPEEKQKYLEEHQQSLPKLEAEELNTLVSDTWKDYFSFMKSGA